MTVPVKEILIAEKIGVFFMAFQGFLAWLNDTSQEILATISILKDMVVTIFQT